MRQQILENINNAEVLEQLYRENKDTFSTSFEEISKTNNTDLITFWKLRLAPDIIPRKKEAEKRNLRMIIFLAVLAGILVKIPTIIGIQSILPFLARNLSMIVFNGLILYSMWENKLFNRRALVTYGIFVMILILYLNFLPWQPGDSVNLACIYAALLFWCFFGFSYIGFELRNIKMFTGFLRFNGELLTMAGLILIAGMIFSAITIQLFSALNLNIEKFYANNILLIGGVITPLVSYYLIRLYPELTNRIAPVIAKIFSPIVLITMVIYLIAFLWACGQVLRKREELIFFNIMLLAVMAIIVFSISDLMKKKHKNLLMLLSLSVLACLINFIALTEIIGRLSLGLTPNRVVVLISNVLIFIHLILISKNIYKAKYKQKPLIAVDSTVSGYMPVYAVWTFIVVFLIPVLFGFK